MVTKLTKVIAVILLVLVTNCSSNSSRQTTKRSTITLDSAAEAICFDVKRFNDFVDSCNRCNSESMAVDSTDVILLILKEKAEQQRAKAIEEVQN